MFEISDVFCFSSSSVMKNIFYFFAGRFFSPLNGCSSLLVVIVSRLNCGARLFVVFFYSPLLSRTRTKHNFLQSNSIAQCICNAGRVSTKEPLIAPYQTCTERVIDGNLSPPVRSRRITPVELMATFRTTFGCFGATARRRKNSQMKQ